MADSHDEKPFAAPIEENTKIPTMSSLGEDVSSPPPIATPTPTPTPQEQGNSPLTTDQPPPPSAPSSVTDESLRTVTPTLGGSTQTQITNVNRGLASRPPTSDRSDPPQFYPNLPLRRPSTSQDDNESLVSRSTAHRTNISSTGGHTRRPPSRSHVPAIMPAYSFYHPLRPPAVAQASGQQEIPEDKPVEEQTRPATSTQSEEISVSGKPSTEPLIPRLAAIKQDAGTLHPVAEVSSRRTSMMSTQLLSTNAPSAPAIAPATRRNNAMQDTDKSRNWQHFPGRTKYHLGGRVQFGTQYWANIGTATLILIPTGLYFAFPYDRTVCELTI